MQHIKSLDTLTRDEVQDLAMNAANCGDHPEHANPFTPGTPNHKSFAAAYQQRAAELGACAFAA